MSPRFLLISQVFYPDEVSTANLFTILCSVLAEDNIEVEVWCAQPSYTESKRQSKRLKYKNIDIHYLASTNFQKTNFPGRILNTITFLTSVSFRLLFSKEKTTIFTHTTPPAIGILISLICSLKKRNFVYILLDIFPKGLIRLNKLSASSLLVKVWDRLFLSALRRSVRIVVIGRDMKELIGNICSQNSDKIEYIPLWQDDDLIFPMDFEENEYVKENGLQGKFVIQYSGNMGLWNEMAAIGKAVNWNMEGVVFMFVGDGIRKKELLSMFSVDQQRNVVMLPFQSNKDLNNSLNACHAGLVSLKEGHEGIAVPSKIYGILAAGIPVIAMVPENSEIAFIVEEEKCGYVLNPCDTEGLIKAIRELKFNDTLRNEMAMNSRLAFEKKYTVRIIAEKYKAMLFSLDMESLKN